MFRWLPEQASEFAHKVDWIHNWITDLSVFFTVVIVGAAIYFAIRYRHEKGKDRETPRIHGDNRFEVIWTVVPTIIVIFIATNGIVIYKDLRNAPPNTIDISVFAKQWDWTFEYPNGKKTYNQATVPVDEPVKFVMRSQKVLHSFFVPSMRVKSDVLPTMYTHVWFKPVKTGSYNVFCTEYCGKNHSAMLAKLNVVPRAEYDRWLADDSEALMRSRMSPSKLGRELYEERKCNTCHSLDGTTVLGPSFKDLWSKKESLEDGSSVAVDENYIESSIRNPASQIVAGYKNLMPSYEGQLSQEEISGLISFIKNLDQILAEEAASGGADDSVSKKPEIDLASMTAEQRGEHWYSEHACSGCHSLNGSRLVGPSFKGLYGRKGKLADGSDYTANDEYLSSSILNPAAQIVKGYQPLMPPYEGQINKDKMADIIAFIKSNK